MEKPPILVFKISGDSENKFYLISKNIPYILYKGIEHDLLIKVPDGKYNAELIFYENHKEIYSGKFAEFKVKNNLIVSFNSKDIKLESKRDASFESVFCFAKLGGRVEFMYNRYAEEAEPSCYEGRCIEGYEECKKNPPYNAS